MKKIAALLCAQMCLIAMYGQVRKHSEKFEQLEYELRDPNQYRTASGAPGPDYWQNTADYVMEVSLDDKNRKITGSETITYTNNSPDPLSYLWVQLDQNVRAKESDSYKIQTQEMGSYVNPFVLHGILGDDFDGGFKIGAVKDTAGKGLPHIINKTMMAVDLPRPLKSGEQFSFSIDWSYNVNDRSTLGYGARSGFEFFPQDGNALYTIAQFFPRMCVYSDVEGWQNKQFLGEGEFAVPFGKYDVKITVPADHVLGATGLLQNPEEVLTETQMARLEEAKTASKPVLIVTEKEAREAERTFAEETKTYHFVADSVRDFAFATSRKFIWDAMGVDIAGKTVMAMSYYPKEGNPLWEQYSTKVVAKTLEVYSEKTFDFPYHKAISVHTAMLGMEYPMICFNFGRPNSDGTYSESTKNSMIMVIIHEIGHNFFPMIVNSDERQWAWMDEGLNTFMQYITEQEWDPDYPSEDGPPANIVPYMKLDPSVLSPIMTNPEQVQDLGPNAYGKPATALNILRETVMGRELFDRAFKEYANRWAFKHPTPADFFRTMEDASGVDLDWFWRGWFYTVDHVDIALEEVEEYQRVAQPVSEKEEEPIMEETDKKKKKRKKKGDPVVPTPVKEEKKTKEFYALMFPEQYQRAPEDLLFYQVKLKNKGGLVMPVILEFQFEDGTSKVERIPAEIWKYNDEEITKVFPSMKKVTKIILDPDRETADTDTSNNV
ncbi:MAG: M1 family metallopeptidase, partial [Bacteroidota bacterium]